MRASPEPFKGNNLYPK